MAYEKQIFFGIGKELELAIGIFRGRRKPIKKEASKEDAYIHGADRNTGSSDGSSDARIRDNGSRGGGSRGKIFAKIQKKLEETRYNSEKIDKLTEFMMQNEDESPDTFSKSLEKRLLAENEPSANIFLGSLMLSVSGLYLIMFFVEILELFKPRSSYTAVMFAVLCVISFFVAFVVVVTKGKPRWVKYFIVVGMTLVVAINVTFTIFGFALMFLVPIMMSCRYYSKRIVYIVSTISGLAAAVTSFTQAYVGVITGNFNVNYFIFKDEIEIIIDGSISESLLENGLISYMDVFRSLEPVRIAILFIIFLVAIGCSKIAQNCLELAKNAVMSAYEKKNAELKAENMKRKIMISQVQPHFLFNALTAIMAIDDNPPETIEAISQFSKFLRENLNSLTEEGLVDFEQEMTHVKHYVSLEKLRFGDKINVIYHLCSESRPVPPLTVQMLVENAIKHGITQRVYGGYVLVRTSLRDGIFSITIADNGVGFDENKIREEKKDHIGILSVKNRVETMCSGKFFIRSTVGKGTVIRIEIPA